MEDRGSGDTHKSKRPYDTEQVGGHGPSLRSRVEHISTREVFSQARTVTTAEQTGQEIVAVGDPMENNEYEDKDMNTNMEVMESVVDEHAKAATKDNPRKRDEKEKEDTVDSLAFYMLACQGKPLSKKHIDRILSLVQAEDYSPQVCRERFHNSDSLRTYVEGMDSAFFQECGFKKLTIAIDEHSSSASLWTRNAAAVLQSLVAGAQPEDISWCKSTNTEGDSEHTFSTPMSGLLATEAFPRVKDFIMSSSDPDIMWRDSASPGPESAIGGLVLYSDASKTSLSASAKTFHPLHIVLMNFSDRYRRQVVTRGESIVAYLPTELTANEDAHERQTKSQEMQDLFHESVRVALRPISENMLRGLVVQDAKGTRRTLHMVLAGYITDIPEGKLIAGTKQGNKTPHPCASCLVRADDLSISLADGVTWRAYPDSLRLREASRGLASSASLQRYSLAMTKPFCHKWPFIDGRVHTLLDFHRVLGYERMHNIHLGLTRMLCDLFQERMTSKTMESSIVVSKAGEPKKFFQIRTTVLRACNYLLSWCDKYSREARFRLDFSKQKSQRGLDGFFTNDGIIGMLEAKDLYGILQIMPFFGAVGDRFCGQQRHCPTVSLFVLYANIAFRILEVDPTGRNGHQVHGMTEANVRTLAQDITRFKTLALSLYQAFQASGMCTNKFHLLSHVPEDIRRSGTLSVFDASAFEASHKLSKDAFRATSRRRTSATQETVRVFTRRQVLYSGHEQPTSAARTQNPSGTHSRFQYKAVQIARQTGVSTIVQKGERIEVSKIINGLLADEERENAMDPGSEREDPRLHDPEYTSLESEFGTNILDAFIDLLGQKDMGGTVTDSENSGVSVRLSQMRLLRVKSGIAVCIPTPTADDINLARGTRGGRQIRVALGQYTTLQRLVASNNYHGQGRYDNVLLEYQKPDTELEQDTNYIYLYAAKCLMLFHVLRKGEDFRRNATSSSNESKSENQFVFVQYYDVEKFRDNVDKTLRCIKLRWARTTEGYPWYDIIPVGSIRGRVHIVRGDISVNQYVYNKDPDWKEEFFYINRFKVPRILEADEPGSFENEKQPT